MYSLNTSYEEYLRGEQRKYPQLKAEDVETLKQSLADDPELPPIPDKKYIAFLQSCDFDLELAKKTVKRCYRFHFRIPRMFCELDPVSDYIEENYNITSVCFMPTTNTETGERILYLQFRDEEAEVFEYRSLYKYLLMWMEYMLLMYGTSDGLIVVINSKGYSLRHVVKIPLGLTAKLIRYMEVGLPVRLKAIHVINSGKASQKVIKIIKRLGKQGLLEKIQTHPVGSEEIFNYVPRTSLPVEAGGLAKSHHFYNDELYNTLIDNCDIFYAQNEILINHMMYLNRPIVDDNECQN